MTIVVLNEKFWRIKSINSIIKLSNLYDKNGSEVTEFIENFLEIFSLGAVFTSSSIYKYVIN